MSRIQAEVPWVRKGGGGAGFVADKASAEADALRREIKDTFHIVTSFVRFPLPVGNCPLVWWWEWTSSLHFE